VSPNQQLHPEEHAGTISMSLELEIKAEAKHLGFAISGICLPDPPKHYQSYLNWLDAGCHADMAYMANPDNKLRRADPHNILPECQSILCLAMPYPSPLQHPKPESQAPTGRISAYAWGQDYHTYIQTQLHQLIATIPDLAGRQVKAKSYVDTGPILEKDYAQAAGLGWIGKNSCLIIPRRGSFFFLAELLLDLPLTPDPPCLFDGCKDCDRCIQACPTSAIRADHSIDANRCIAYLTIENRGAIPQALRPKLNDWIFGCDICQSVCPHNQHSLETPIPDAFTNSQINPFPELVEELMLSEEAFEQKYQGTALLRPRRQGYLRNVAIALGNQRSSEVLPFLKKTSETDQDPVVREACAWALAQYPSKT